MIYGENIRRYFIFDPDNINVLDKTNFAKVFNTTKDFKGCIVGNSNCSTVGIVKSNFITKTGFICIAKVTYELEELIYQKYPNAEKEDIIAMLDTDTDIEADVIIDKIVIKDKKGNEWVIEI